LSKIQIATNFGLLRKLNSTSIIQLFRQLTLPLVIGSLNF